MTTIKPRQGGDVPGLNALGPLFGSQVTIAQGDFPIVSSRRQIYEHALVRIGEVAMVDAWPEGRSTPLDDVIAGSRAPFTEHAAA